LDIQENYIFQEDNHYLSDEFNCLPHFIVVAMGIQSGWWCEIVFLTPHHKYPA
jgi:hypothetical protein